MSYKETIYDYMDKTNTSYEEFEKTCYERAEAEPDPIYAKEGLDFAKALNEIKRLYDENTSVASAVYLLCM